VTTDVGSIREVVVNGHNGFLVPAGNGEQLTTRIVSLLEDPLRCQEMGAAARQTVVAGWSVDNMVRNYERLIAAVFARKQAKDRPQHTIETPAEANIAVAEPAQLTVS
jgi:glycosyltransferase involved in cell wall biosynthesis